jgi:hypothetical protein
MSVQSRGIGLKSALNNGTTALDWLQIGVKKSLKTYDQIQIRQHTPDGDFSVLHPPRLGKMAEIERDAYERGVKLPGSDLNGCRIFEDISLSPAIISSNRHAKTDSSDIRFFAACVTANRQTRVRPTALQRRLVAIAFARNKGPFTRILRCLF